MASALRLLIKLMKDSGYPAARYARDFKSVETLSYAPSASASASQIGDCVSFASSIADMAK